MWIETVDGKKRSTFEIEDRETNQKYADALDAVQKALNKMQVSNGCAIVVCAMLAGACVADQAGNDPAKFAELLSEAKELMGQVASDHFE